MTRSSLCSVPLTLTFGPSTNATVATIVLATPGTMITSLSLITTTIACSGSQVLTETILPTHPADHGTIVVLNPINTSTTLATQTAPGFADLNSSSPPTSPTDGNTDPSTWTTQTGASSGSALPAATIATSGSLYYGIPYFPTLVNGFLIGAVLFY